MIGKNSSALTVGKLREQSALDNAATNVKVLVVDGPTGKIVECLSAIRCYPDTTDELGNLVSTFKIIVDRPPKAREENDPTMTIEALLDELNCLGIGIPGEPVIDPKIIYTSPTGRRLYITRHHIEGGIENWPLPGKYEVRLGDRTIYGEHIEISELLGKEPAPAKRKR